MSAPRGSSALSDDALTAGVVCCMAQDSGFFGEWVRFCANLASIGWEYCNRHGKACRQGREAVAVKLAVHRQARNVKSNNRRSHLR